MHPTAPTFIPSAPPLDASSAPALPAAHTPQAHTLAQAALDWQRKWHDGLTWSADALARLYPSPVRDGLRGWGRQLESMAMNLERQAMAGLTEGIPERLAQFDRIWDTNQRILDDARHGAQTAHAGSAMSAAQKSIAEFLINRNTFFKNYDAGRFDAVGQLAPQDRAAFNDRMDRLETCSDPQVGHDLLRWLDRYASRVSPTPLRRF